MLDKPNIDVNTLIDALSRYWGLQIGRLEFSPSGMDSWNFIADGQYFIKLSSDSRQVPFSQLRRYQLDQIGFVLPLASQSKQFHHQIAGFEVTVFPYIDGQQLMSLAEDEKPDWQHELGRVIRQLHTTPISEGALFPGEDFSRFQSEAEFLLNHAPTSQPHLAEVQKMIRQYAKSFSNIIHAARRLSHTYTPVLCHGDIHEANVIVNGSGLFVVDLDSMIIAPAERDLFFFLTGSGERGSDNSLSGYFQEQARQINPKFIEYYIYEWALQELVDYWALLADPQTTSEHKEEYLAEFYDMFSDHGDFGRAFRLLNS